MIGHGDQGARASECDRLGGHGPRWPLAGSKQRWVGTVALGRPSLKIHFPIF
jgi:hypothetical protein